MSALRELLATFEIEVDDKKLKEAHEHIKGFKDTLRSVAKIAAEAFAVDYVKEFAESIIEAGAATKDTADRLGVTTDELQAFRLAASQAGATNEDLDTGLRFLNRNLAEAAEFGGNTARVFQDLGIAVKDSNGRTRDAGAVLEELADKVAAIDDPAKQTQAAMTLLGRGGAELIPLLQQGGKAFAEAREQVVALGGGMREGFIDQAKEADDQIARMRFALTGLKSELVGASLPAVREIVDWLTRFTAGASQLQRETGALSTAVEFFGAIAAVKALGSLKEIAKELGILKGTVRGTVLAFFEFAAPLVAIGLLYLAFDELVNLLKGNDTLIGRALGPEKAKFALFDESGDSPDRRFVARAWRGARLGTPGTIPSCERRDGRAG